MIFSIGLCLLVFGLLCLYVWCGMPTSKPVWGVLWLLASLLGLLLLLVSICIKLWSVMP